MKEISVKTFGYKRLMILSSEELVSGYARNSFRMCLSDGRQSPCLGFSKLGLGVQGRKWSI